MLIRKSKVIEIETDEKPFSHNIEQYDNGSNQKYATFNVQQAMYNSIKKQSMLGSKAPNKLNPKKDEKLGDIKLGETHPQEEGYKYQILQSTKSGHVPGLNPDDIKLGAFAESSINKVGEAGENLNEPFGNQSKPKNALVNQINLQEEDEPT